MWSRPLLDPNGVNRRLVTGQITIIDTRNMHGAYEYLWTKFGPTWHAYDPATGRWEYTMTNVPTASGQGDLIYGPKGEMIRYTVNTAQGWMIKWNSTNIRSLFGPANGFFAQS